MEAKIRYAGTDQRGIPVRIECLVGPAGVQLGWKHEFALPRIRDTKFPNRIECLAD
jgi:hypothetical protein